MCASKMFKSNMAFWVGHVKLVCKIDSQRAPEWEQAFGDLVFGNLAFFIDQQGNTALTLAAQRGNAEIIKSLITKGASKSAVTSKGNSALDLANLGKIQYPKKKDNYEKVISLLNSQTTLGTKHNPRSNFRRSWSQIIHHSGIFDVLPPLNR